MGKKSETTTQHFFVCVVYPLKIAMILVQCLAGLYAQPPLQLASNYRQLLYSDPPGNIYAMQNSMEESNQKIFSSTMLPRTLRLKSNSKMGKSLVNTCIVTGCYGVLAAIIKDDAKVNDRDKYQNTPLHIACARGNDDIVKLLLKNEANVKLKNIDDNAAIHMAAQSGCLNCLMLLINHSADINAKGENGLTALHLASINGDIAMMIYLLKKKANKTLRDKMKKIPLDYAKNDATRDILEGIVDFKDVSSL